MRLEESLRSPIANNVELLAGTSTGAITAGAIAAGLHAAHIYDLFTALAKEVFRPRMFSALRGGGRYDPKKLNDLLLNALGTVQLGQLGVPLVITASVVDTHSAKTFSSVTDPSVALVDAIMASCSAPTYFPPRRITGDRRGFYDGGLWANDPLDVATTWAARHLQVAPSEVSALSLGTGRIPSGSAISDLERMPTLSIQTVRNIWEMTTSLQASASDMLAGLRLPEGAVVRINPELPQWVPLDDAYAALRILPGIADQTYERTGDAAVRALSLVPTRSAHETTVRVYSQENQPSEYSLEELLRTATKFYFLARSGVTLFAAYEEQLANAIRRGCDVRFVTTDPAAPGFLAHDDTKLNKLNLMKTRTHLVRLRDVNPKMVQIRLTNYASTAGIMYVEHGGGVLLSVQLYFASGRRGRDRPLLFLGPSDPLFAMYLDELTNILNASKPWDVTLEME